METHPRMLFGCWLVLVAAVASQAAEPMAPAPTEGQNLYNVLFIAIDDLRPELGCYGVREAQSPHLDRLASQGVLFEHHYVQVPTCGASRYALLTGRCPTRSGVTSSNAALYDGPSSLTRDAQPRAQSLPELFRRSGYRTVCIGKLSHTPDGRVFAYNGSGDGRPELPGAWDELATPFGPWKRGWGAFFAYSGGRHREDGKGYKDLMEFEAEDDDDLPDGLLARAAVEQLESLKREKRPFFLGLGFYKPHLPFVATRGDWEAFADAEIAVAPAAKIDSPYWHSSGEFYKYAFPFPKDRPLSREARRDARRAYLACIRYVDRQVGRVLGALDRLGLSERTVVVVWGDHGWHLGEQQIWGKHSPFERALRSVLIIRAPDISRPGLRTEALVETLDIYPTLVDICRPRNPQTRYPLDGQSLRPLLEGAVEQHRKYARSYWKTAVSLRTDTHRLIARKKAGSEPKDIELYDLSGGPDAPTNVAGERKDLVEKLRALVESNGRQ